MVKRVELLKFNINKCKVMHCGNHNPRALFYMRTSNGETIEETHKEKGLGVHVSNALKLTLHCSKAANKAMCALRLLRMAFGSFIVSNFKILYSVYIRHLEHCIQATGP